MSQLPPPPTEPHDPPRAPIWAPNPGVPLTARILAITFGVLLALTVIISLVGERPPDQPLLPKAWDTYATKSGITARVPDGWVSQVAGETDEFTCVRFWQRDGGPVTVDLLGWRLPREIDDAIRAAVAKEVEADLRTSCTGYAPAAPDGDRRRFTCTLDGHAMAGAWTRIERGRAVAVLIALTPAAGATTMDAILDEMAAGVAMQEE